MINGCGRDGNDRGSVVRPYERIKTFKVILVRKNYKREIFSPCEIEARSQAEADQKAKNFAHLMGADFEQAKEVSK
jgi:hypothetical protein